MPYRSILVFSLILLISGCAKPAAHKAALLTPSEAEKRFVEICKADYGLEVITKRLKNTLWVIYPSTEPFFQIKATPQGPQSSAEAKESPAIKYLEGKYENNDFVIQYDIGTSRSYAKDFGYSTGYSDKIQDNQRNIMTAVSRAFTDAEDGQTEDSDKLPAFIVMVMADITSGIEMRSFLAYKDLKRAMEDQSFYEEFVQRMIIDYPQGNMGLIGDRTAEGIETYDLTWGDFLAKQIIYRINFKYQRSAFPPGEQTQQELLKITSNVVNLYKFEDFNQVSLENLDNKETFSVTKAELPAPEKASEGRIINIKFLP